jgi:uncharacterized protein (DUF58 family)
MIWPFVKRTPSLEAAWAPAPDAAAIVRRARRLRFRVQPQAVALLAGAYHGARPGVGLMFSELRAYEPGDDVRHLDWNVTARQGKPFVRRFTEERALTLWLIVDISASLRFGRDGRSKADRAAQAAALLATAAIQNGDRVGLAMVSDRLEAELTAGGGPRHLARVLRALVATPALSRGTALSAGLDRFRRRTTRRALIVVLSDFLSAEPVGVWRQVSRRHQVIALRLVDPHEESLADAGLLDLEHSEQRTRCVVDAGSRRVRAAYAEAAGQRRTGFRRFCAAAGLSGSEISTAEDPIGPLIRLFTGRATRRGTP